MLDTRTILVHMLLSRVRKHSGCGRPKVHPRRKVVLSLLVCAIEDQARRRPVGPVGLEAPRGHALEPERQRALCEAGFHEGVGVVQRGAAGGAVVVHVCDGYAGEAEVVEGTLCDVLEWDSCVYNRKTYLAACRISVAVTNVCSFNSIIGDT